MSIKIGTRGSPLALVQAHQVRDTLKAAHNLGEDDFEIVVIKTSGDMIQDRPLSEVGGKGLFTKEIEQALVDKSIDLAVHSTKDVATVLPDGLTLACLLPREDVRDAFLSPKAKTLTDLPQGAIVGSSSLRRQAQILRQRPDLKVIMFRGNVQTRLRKLSEGVADATLLACAGLRRLGNAELITSVIEVDDMLPAPAQGAISIEIRQDNDKVRDLLQPLHHEETAICVAAERAFLAKLDGSCRTPIAALATLDSGTLTLRGQILLPDGTQSFETTRSGPAKEALIMGQDAATELIASAGPDFMRQLAG